MTFTGAQRVGVAAVLLVFSVATSPNLRAQAPGEQPAAQNGGTCIAIILPSVTGVEGNAIDVATGLRELFTTYLTSPSIRIVALAAPLQTLAAEEAQQKQCDRMLLARLTRKRGSGRFGKVLGDAAASAAWYMPLGATGSAVARGAAIAGAQAVSTLSSTTKAKDEMRLEYQLAAPGGPTRFGPKTDTVKAQVDGEDLLTPLVRKAAEAIVTEGLKK
jgi:hypothetical protein